MELMAKIDVPDPYDTRDFDGALDIIEAAALKLVRRTPVQPDQ